MKRDAKTKLLVQHNEAKEKLLDRIEKGRIISTEVRSAYTDTATVKEKDWLKSKEREHSKWNKFNLKLLETMFTNDHEQSFYANNIALRSYNAFTEFRTKIGWLADDIDSHINSLESILESIDLYQVTESNNSDFEFSSKSRNQVFIVHGHDNEVKQEVARFIEKLGFEPIILHEQASSSRTIIEKIEEYSNVGFGVILYTPCDVGATQSESDNLQGRARQNVVFEHGYLIGKLGRKNVCALVKGELEKPNDISGIVYTSMNNGNWQIDFAKELKASGYDVDMNKVV